MGERIADEIPRSSLAASLSAPSSESSSATASNSTDGPPSIMCLAAIQLPSAASTPPTFGATISIVGAFLLDCRLKLLQQRSVCTGADQDAYLAAGEAVGAVLDDAECRRRLQIVARRNRSIGRFGKLLHPQLVRDGLG